MTNTQICNRGVNEKKSAVSFQCKKKLLAELNLVEKCTTHLLKKWK